MAASFAAIQYSRRQIFSRTLARKKRLDIRSKIRLQQEVPQNGLELRPTLFRCQLPTRNVQPRYARDYKQDVWMCCHARCTCPHQHQLQTSNTQLPHGHKMHGREALAGALILVGTKKLLHSRFDKQMHGCKATVLALSAPACNKQLATHNFSKDATPQIPRLASTQPLAQNSSASGGKHLPDLLQASGSTKGATSGQCWQHKSMKTMIS